MCPVAPSNRMRRHASACQAPSQHNCGMLAHALSAPRLCVRCPGLLIATVQWVLWRYDAHHNMRRVAVEFPCFVLAAVSLLMERRHARSTEFRVTVGGVDRWIDRSAQSGTPSTQYSSSCNLWGAHGAQLCVQSQIPADCLLMSPALVAF